MRDGPVVDGRGREELLADLTETADHYTDRWDPHTDDTGTTLLKIFSRLGTEVTQRLDSVPEKHRLAFLDTLDFDRRPPQSARLPLTFEVSEDVEGNVAIPGGTQAVAETGDDETEIFEVPQDAGFEATPASLEDVVGVEPATDRIFDHGESLTGGEPTTLFTGENLQEHVLYLGHEDLLNLDLGSTLTVVLRTNASEQVLEEDLVWEYYGEDGTGEVGWHSLDRQEKDIMDVYSEIDTGIDDLREALHEQLENFSSGKSTEWGDNAFELTFELPGETEKLAVNDVESRWIRCRATGDQSAYLRIEVESIGLNVERSEDDGGIDPGNVLSNDVPLSLDGGDDVYPFGRMPQPPTTLYLASEEAFTKRGATVAVEFAPPRGDGPGEDGESGDASGDAADATAGGAGLVGGPPEISWEYWNGTAWARLDLQRDDTDRFREAGRVEFTVPDDLRETSVSGHDDFWIRARLVSGNYGQPRFEVTSEGTRGELLERPSPPRFSDVTISYDQGGESFEHVFAYNNVAHGDDHADHPDTFVPFRDLPDDKQTLYLGFSEPLHDGPINLHVPVRDESYPRTFDPAIRWEYCPDPDRGEWKKLDVHDGTGGLTERGIVSVNVPHETTAFELFDRERHWIRVRVTQDEFVHETPDAAERTGAAAGPSGEMTPPTLEGILPNTQWAYNAETISDEVLGGSDGSHGQSFSCANVPVTEIEVWVDELDALSAGQRRELREGDAEVEVIEGPGGEPLEFWVRWTEVDDFLDSGESARHYVVDRTGGRVDFGDGLHGAIPPKGDANVRATYKTGGGSEGNVEAGSIEELKTSVSLVESVTNHRPSDGGADVESLDAVAERAPRRIKNRGRAVSASDFEQVATAASRELAKVKCEPQLDDEGDRTPGWVTLLVVPKERRERPTPSMELKGRVREAVSERAPATLVGGEQSRIVVRGPTYAAFSVDVTVSTRGVKSISQLKATVEDRLDDFFHPLTGGKDGDGWAFGECPRLSDLATLVEAVDGVDGVESVRMSYVDGGEEITVTDEDASPDLGRDTLICSGTHEVRVNMNGGR